MKQIKKMPSINIPIQKADGSMEWVWYMFLQWLSENSKQTITTGDENGTIAVDGNDVPVKGLGSAAYHSDDDYVHKTGNETIADKKTFIGTSDSWELPICIKNTNPHAIADQVPTGSTGKGISFVDKNGVLEGYVEFYRHESQSRYLSLNIAQNNQFYSCIAIGFNNNGDVFTEAPTPPASSSTTSLQMATCGWVNDYTLSTGIVHKAGYEVITDAKAFHVTGGTPIMLRNTDDDSTIAPSTLKAASVGIEDKNGVWQGGWEHYHAEDGNVYKNMAVKQPGANNYAVIQVGITPSGTQWTSAPTPNTNSWDTNIATTAFVKNVLNAIWPVGAIYLSITNYCPLAGIIGTWELVQAGRALWTGNGQTGNYSGVTDKVTAAHNVIWEGLPNITGTTGIYWTERNTSGAFYWDDNVRGGERNDPHGAGNLGFNAAYGNSVYNLGRVQPESYVVNVWRRIA